jgi:heme/copper-type cytochrome/quinol oxidase subunit 2
MESPVRTTEWGHCGTARCDRLRGLKIWWSFAWRTMILMLLIMVPLEIIMMVFLVRAMPTAGAKGLDPAQALRMASVMLIAWPILMAVIVVLQAQAMRWMLRRAQWPDFKIAVVPH